jgi:hypothetical protein
MHPQATAVPSDLRATLKLSPAAIAVTSDNPAGTYGWSQHRSPQATIGPSRDQEGDAVGPGVALGPDVAGQRNRVFSAAVRRDATRYPVRR